MRDSVLTLVVASICAVAVPGAASAAAPACAPSAGPYEYQAGLLAFMNDPAPAPPTAPASMSRMSGATGGGATGAAREALGDQFTMLWFNSTLQGWVVGVAPGPLDLQQARAAIVDRLSARFAPDDVAFLAQRLHLDAQPYRESELKATQAGVQADLTAAGLGVAWSVGYGLCQLSDAIRVEIGLYADSTPEIVERVRALMAPYGDRVRLGVSPHGPPTAMALPLIGGAPRPPGIAVPAPLSIGRYVSMVSSARCVRGARINVAVRGAQRGKVALLTVRANGRRRTIGGARLRSPITVKLTHRRTSVVVAVKLRNGLRGERTVTVTRCR